MPRITVSRSSGQNKDGEAGARGLLLARLPPGCHQLVRPVRAMCTSEVSTASA